MAKGISPEALEMLADYRFSSCQDVSAAAIHAAVKGYLPDPNTLGVYPPEEGASHSTVYPQYIAKITGCKPIFGGSGYHLSYRELKKIQPELDTKLEKGAQQIVEEIKDHALAAVGLTYNRAALKVHSWPDALEAKKLFRIDNHVSTLVSKEDDSLAIVDAWFPYHHFIVTEDEAVKWLKFSWHYGAINSFLPPEASE